MKINPINQMSFKGISIDAHVHTNGWSSDKAQFTSKDIFELTNKPFNISINGIPEKEEIKYVLISNLDCMDIKDGKPLANELEGNTTMLKEQAAYPKHRPLAVCQAGCKDASPENIEKLLQENPKGFIGLKFHPEQFERNADNVVYEGYMKLAQKYKLPCLFHSGKVDSYSDPVKIYAQAKKFPDVPVIMAHMGIRTKHDEAANVLLESIKKGDAKLYGDTSWMQPDEIVELIEKLRKTSKGDMTERLLFGTDAPLGEFGDPAKKVRGYYADNIGKIKSAIKTRFGDDGDNIINKIFHDNADELFFKKKWTEGLADSLAQGATNPETVKKLPKGKIGAIFTAGLLAVGAATLTLYNKFKGVPQGLAKLEGVTQDYSSVLQDSPKPIPVSQNYNGVFKDFVGRY